MLSTFEIMANKISILFVVGFFLTILGVDVLLFVDSVLPECSGYFPMSLIIPVLVLLYGGGFSPTAACESVVPVQIVGVMMSVLGMYFFLYSLYMKNVISILFSKIYRITKWIKYWPLLSSKKYCLKSQPMWMYPNYH